MHNHPKADISQFTIIDQDRMQVSREAREAIHIRKNNPALNYNIGKMNIPKICNQILGTSYSTSTDVSTNHNKPNNNPSSSNRATRALNLHTIVWYTHTISTLTLLSKVLVHLHYRYTPTTFF